MTAANRLQWKKFAFFEKDTVNENIYSSLESAVTCAYAESGLILFGDVNGFISLSDRNLRLSWKHKAFRGPVKGMAYIEDHFNLKKPYVVAVGDEYARPVAADGSPADPLKDNTGDFSPNTRYAVKIFAVTDMTRPIQAFLVSQSNVQGFPLTAFAANSDCSQIALGFANGAVIMYAGHFLREYSLGRSQSPVVLFPNNHASVSALHFCDLSSFAPPVVVIPPTGSTAGTSGATSGAKDKLRQIRLFALLDTEGKAARMGGLDPSGQNTVMSTENDDGLGGSGGIFVFDVSTPLMPREMSSSQMSNTSTAITMPRLGAPRMLDERGAGPECSAVVPDTAELLVGRQEGVFLYSVEDRGGAAGFEGDKQCVTSIGRYILVGSMDVKTRRVLITIYDLRNKFITMSHLLAPAEQVKMVLHDGNISYVITSTGGLIRFREKDTASKIDVLLKKSLHSLAIALAAEEQAPAADVMKLYKIYADHLFNRGDMDGAIAQYSHTIGFVPASYVIRRFLDSQKVSYLTSYLETLHEKGFASRDLTTLLLTCYTKTRDVEHLDKFINGGVQGGNDSPTIKDALNGAKFDVSAAIATLKQAGYHSHAMQLALRYGDSDGYLTMLLDKDANGSAPDGKLAFEHLVAVVGDTLKCIKNDLASKNTQRFVHRRASNSRSNNGLRISENTNSKIEFLLVLLRRHGRRILALSRNAMTGLLIVLCTGINLPANTGISSTDSNNSNTLQLQRDDAFGLAETLNSLCTIAFGGSSEESSAASSNTKILSEPVYTVEEMASIFIEEEYSEGNSSLRPADLNISTAENMDIGWQRTYLMKFLDGVSLCRTGISSSSSSGGGGVKYNTWLSPHMTGLLIELCLFEHERLVTSSDTHNNNDYRRAAITQLEVKIMNILDGTIAAEYDPAHVMLLVHSFNFRPGMVYLLEKSQSVDLILGKLRDNKDYRGIFRILRKEGKKQPELLLHQLKLFVLESIPTTSSSSNREKSGLKSKSKAKVVDSDDESGSSRQSGSESSSSSSEEDSDNEDERYVHIEELLDIIMPEIMYASASSDSAGADHSGQISVRQVLSILAINPELPLGIALDVIKGTLKGASLGLPNLEKECYKMRLTVNGLIDSKKQQMAEKERHTYATDKKSSGQNHSEGSTQASVESKFIAANPFGDESDDDEFNDGYKQAVSKLTVVDASSKKNGSSKQNAVVDMMIEYGVDESAEDEYDKMVQQAELAREKQHWEAIKKAQLETVNDHEDFYKEVAGSTDGFATIASFFSKKLIS